MRRCHVINYTFGRMCGHTVHHCGPVPICSCCARLFLAYLAPCDFFHFANAGLIRAREARN